MLVLIHQNKVRLLNSYFTASVRSGWQKNISCYILNILFLRDFFIVLRNLVIKKKH